MGKIRWIIASLVALDILIGTGHAFAQRNEMPAGYPQSLEPALQALLGRLHEGNPSPGLLVRLAEAYFDLADDLLTDEAKPLAAYEAGAMAAKQAIELDESNADAHFFHAVNLGSAERLRGVTNAALAVKEIKHCAQRAIELNPKHARALQMMGGLLMELPWILGGNEKKAQEYLERAIAADGNYTNARILVAKLYKKQGRIDDAKRQLETVIHADRPITASPGSGSTNRWPNRCSKSWRNQALLKSCDMVPDSCRGGRPMLPAHRMLRLWITTRRRQ